MEKCDGQDVEGVSSCMTRQSTWDITAALVFCGKYASGWVVLVEDDNLVCEGALDELVSTLGLVDRHATALVKFSPSSTGMSFPVGKLGKYVNYSLGRVRTHQHDVTRSGCTRTGDACFSTLGGCRRRSTGIVRSFGYVRVYAGLQVLLDVRCDLLKRFAQCVRGLAGAAAAQQTPHELEVFDSDARYMVRRLVCPARSAQDQQLHSHLSEFHEFNHFASQLVGIFNWFFLVEFKFKQLVPACQRRRLH